jgi:hypothetical protein
MVLLGIEQSVADVPQDAGEAPMGRNIDAVQGGTAELNHVDREWGWLSRAGGPSATTSSSRAGSVI